MLDIGAYDGFYSFEVERLGAARVVALDHYVWSLELGEHIKYWNECKEGGVVPEPYHATPHWRPAELPGKRGYDTAHRALDSRVETVVADFMNADISALGTFDVVLFLGVLYPVNKQLSGRQGGCRWAVFRRRPGLAADENPLQWMPGVFRRELNA